MRLRRALVVVTSVLALVFAGGGSAVASGQAPTSSTRDNALAAMRGEAYAHATYLAYGAVAGRSGQTRVARLFERVATVELDEHFTEEAALIGYGRSNAGNVQSAISGETYESTTMYPQFAATARVEGCTAAARLFAEIARDEAAHAANFRRALAVLRGAPGRIPAPPSVTAVPFRASTPACGRRTQDNLLAAMHGESFANANYTLYARWASRTGKPELARLFAGSAQVELREHFADESILAGLVRSTRASLRTAISGETYEGTTMYPRFAAQARAAGDRDAARVFREIGREEQTHAALFAAELRRIA